MEKLKSILKGKKIKDIKFPRNNGIILYGCRNNIISAYVNLLDTNVFYYNKEHDKQVVNDNGLREICILLKKENNHLIISLQSNRWWRYWHCKNFNTNTTYDTYMIPKQFDKFVNLLVLVELDLFTNLNS